MMETPNVRKERIEKLLRELEYELTRGIMEREIEESLGFQFIIPRSVTFPKGIVFAEFNVRPMPHMPYRTGPTGLYVVK